MAVSITAITSNEDALPRWFVYIIENRLGHYYCGITTDPLRRIAQHRGERVGGAKALKGKAPLHYKAVFEVAGKRDALSLEHQIKKLSKAQKQALVSGQTRIGAVNVTDQFNRA